MSIRMTSETSCPKAVRNFDVNSALTRLLFSFSHSCSPLDNHLNVSREGNPQDSRVNGKKRVRFLLVQQLISSQHEPPLVRLFLRPFHQPIKLCHLHSPVRSKTSNFLARNPDTSDQGIFRKEVEPLPNSSPAPRAPLHRYRILRPAKPKRAQEKQFPSNDGSPFTPFRRFFPFFPSLSLLRLGSNRTLSRIALKG